MAVLDRLIPEILNIFNSFHTKLQFTIEISETNSLNFLDITVIVNNEHLEFKWFRKPTFSGRLLNYHSNHPLIHKRGVVIGLTDKIFKLSHLRYQERNFIDMINILIHNSYPMEFIFKTIHNRIKYLINRSIIRDVPNQPSVPPLPSFFTIPYIKNFSEKFFSQCKKFR